jgi:hypothetical protein
MGKWLAIINPKAPAKLKDAIPTPGLEEAAQLVKK